MVKKISPASPVRANQTMVNKLTRFSKPTILYIILGISMYLLSLAYGANIPYVFTGIMFAFLIGVINVVYSSGYKKLSWVLSVLPLLTFIALALTNRIPLMFQTLNTGQTNTMGAAQGIFTAAIGAGQAALGAGQGIGQAALGGGQGIGQAALGAGQGIGQAALGGVNNIGQAAMGGINNMGQVPMGPTAMSMGPTALSMGQPPMSMGQPPMSMGQPPMSMGQPPMSMGPTVPTSNIYTGPEP